MGEAVLIYGFVLLDQLGSRFPSSVGGCAGPQLVLLDSLLLNTRLIKASHSCKDFVLTCAGGALDMLTYQQCQKQD